MTVLLALWLGVTPAFAHCANEVWGEGFTPRVREMQDWVLKSVHKDGDEPLDFSERLLEIAQELKSRAAARLADLPSELRPNSRRNLDLVDIESASHLSGEDALDLALTLTHLNVLLRLNDKPELGAMPGFFVALLVYSTDWAGRIVEVTPISGASKIAGRLLLEPLDDAAFDLVFETGLALRPATGVLRSVFAPRWRFKPEVARGVTTRLATALPTLNAPRLADLLTSLRDLWDAYDAGDTSVFREIGATLEEVHRYLELAVRMNRAHGIPDVLE